MSIICGISMGETKPCRLEPQHSGRHYDGTYFFSARVPDDPWMDAGRSAIYAAVALSQATTIGAQGHAMIELQNAISDLASFLPEYDFEAGIDSITGPMED